MTLADNLVGFWQLVEYTNSDSLYLTSTILVFISKDSIDVPLSDHMPLNTTRGKWRLLDSKPPAIEIFCEDTVFAGTWELTNIQMNTVPQFSEYIKSFDIVRGSCVLTFER
jgi:hypothetical protein